MSSVGCSVNKVGRRLTVSKEGFIHGIATSQVQVSYTRYHGTSSQVILDSIRLYIQE